MSLILDHFCSSVLLFLAFDLLTQAFQEADQKLLRVMLEISLEERAISIKSSLEVASVYDLLAVHFRIDIDFEHLLQQYLLILLFLLEVLLLEVAAERRCSY